MTQAPPATEARLYDEGADQLLEAAAQSQRVNLIPGQLGGKLEPGNRIRIQWGQDMLRDVLDGRYRTVVCAVNEEDNAHGIIGQLVNLVETSQWTVPAVTAYAKQYQKSVGEYGDADREPFVLKFDLDSLNVFALLRPRGRDHFTLKDLANGFATVVRMLRARGDRQPACAVSFMSGKRNRLVEADTGPNANREPSFETVLRTMYTAGFRGDVYPSFRMWDFVDAGVFPTYPFPEGFDRMREGSS